MLQHEERLSDLGVARWKVAGTLTSVAGDVALAYIGRDVEPPSEATVRWDGGEVPARIETLPLAS